MATRQQGTHSSTAAEPGPDEGMSPVVERPDGYYWQTLDGRQEFGPFESYEAARLNRDAESEESLAPGDTLRNVEDEIGIASWIDPETGDPAEGESPPHIPEE